ncbi:E3 ubiquitin-protein ligase RING1-like [Apostasia shenzhenica]|uniref:RING-type E3 ubiquitin transferase n=1 Tax=Apostasia shenzhenica TaxID=1088818 RepID=A0A2I0AIZ4_9ASPA|nr:E3 ubiquitin-protein ligase RING1-like [Apostasia shenzhenica]
MSLLRPPPLRRAFHLFWCHHCRRPVPILLSPSAASTIFCPRCSGRFIHELDPPFPTYHLLLTPPPSPPNQSLPSAPNRGDYFTGPDLNQLIEELTQNDRPGPPPAPVSSIDALPTVKIAAEHLREGSQCPVCKEEFTVGEEAKEMPCGHVYHSDCIVPWLRLHDSCPVCRSGLAGGEIAGRELSTDRGGAGDGDRRNLRLELWNPLALLFWPFHDSMFPGWERYHRYAGDRWEEGGRSLGSSGGNGAMLRLLASIFLFACLLFLLFISSE